MSVEINNKTKSKIDLSLIKKAAEKFLRAHKKIDYSVSIAFVGDEKIKELNKKYRRIDRITDVLSFAGEEKFLGEVIIDYSQIKRQAKEFRGRGMRAVEEELVFILAHGLLHLLGYDDGTEVGRREMERLGEEFIKISNF